MRAKIVSETDITCEWLCGPRSTDVDCGGYDAGRGPAAAALLLQDLKPLTDVGQFLKLLAPHGFDVNDFVGPKVPGAAKARAKRRKS